MRGVTYEVGFRLVPFLHIVHGFDQLNGGHKGVILAHLKHTEITAVFSGTSGTYLELRILSLRA